MCVWMCESDVAIFKLKILIQNCSMYFISALCVCCLCFVVWESVPNTRIEFPFPWFCFCFSISFDIHYDLWFCFAFAFTFAWTNTVPHRRTDITIILLLLHNKCVVKIIIIYFPDIRFIHLWNNQMYEPVVNNMYIYIYYICVYVFYFFFLFIWVLLGKASGTGRRTKDTTLLLTGPKKWLRYDCFGYLT